MDFSKRLVRAVPVRSGGVFRFPKPFPPYSGIPPPEFHRPELEVHCRSPENGYGIHASPPKRRSGVGKYWF